MKGGGGAGKDEKKLSHLNPHSCPPAVQLELSVNSHKDYHPGEVLKLQLHTDSAALVALGAVDMALYAVGSRTHKPLDMGKVCEDLLPALPHPLGRIPSACPLLPASLKPWGLGLISPLSVSHICPSRPRPQPVLPLSHLLSPTALPFLARSSKS